MYVLTKFQLHILKTIEVTALQSITSRKIDLYSKHRENKLQVLTKTGVIYDVQTRNLHHHVHHELQNELLGKLFLLHPCITTNKVEIHEEISIATIASMSHEQAAITYNSFGAL